MTKELITFIAGAVTIIFIWIIQYFNSKYPKAKEIIYSVNKILIFLENFIKNNQDLLNEPWQKFKKRFIVEVEEHLKFDLPDEIWDYLFILLYEKYKRIKKQLENTNIPET